MADNKIRNPAKAYFKWKMPVIAKSEDDWNFWNTDDKYNRTMFIGYNDLTTPHVASLFLIVDGKAIQAVGDDVLARISQMETDVAEALADIQELINTANEQQQTIMQLQQQVQAVLLEVQGYVEDAHTWAEGSDADVAELGGEHSAKGWAQKANDIVAAGLPSDATFDHITVTGNSMFGKDPDRGNQPGLEIEGTGEIQAYRTVNMMNGATVSYDETVEMPWSDSSNKVPNTAWVQQAVMHGVIDPNTELTVKKISTSTGGAFLNASHTTSNGSKYQAYLSVHKSTSDTDDSYIEAAVYSSADSITSSLHLHTLFTRLQTPTLFFDGGNKSAGTEAIRLGQASGQAYQTTRYLYCEYPGRFVNGLQVGFINDADADGIPFKILRSDNTTIGKWMAAFGVTPTVPDITDAADSSDKVPNTKWVQAAIAAGGGGSGAVTSVNGKTGEVVLAAADVGAAPADALAGYVTTDAMNTELAGKQDKLTAESDLAVNNLTAASVSSSGTIKAAKADNSKYAQVANTGLTYSSTGADNYMHDITDYGLRLRNLTSGGSHKATLIAGLSGSNACLQSNDGFVFQKSPMAALDPRPTSTYLVMVGDTINLATNTICSASMPAATDSSTTVPTTGWVQDAIAAKTANLQPKLTAGANITISEDNVISATGGTGGEAVSSVNGKTGEVVLNATDVGAITGAEADTKITTALEPYAKTADVTTTLEPYAKSADVTAEITAAVSPLATTEALTTGLAGKQDKLTAGSGIAISDTNVISATVSVPVDSVNGKTGTVVLSGEDIRLHPTAGEYTYPAVSDVIDSISGYLPDGVSGDNKLVDNSSLWTYLALYQPKLTAGEGITISAENVISATGGGAVTSVNGNTGAVVLTGDNVMTASDSTTSINTALAGKQANITADTELTCKSITTGYDSALKSLKYAGNISFTGDSGNGSLGKITANELFINSSGYYGTRIQASGITCTSGAGGVIWFNLNSSDKTISVDGTITATSPAVDANNNQVATTSWVKTALAGKQDSLTASSDLTVGSLTAGSADSGLYAGTYSIRYTYNGNDKLFVDATGPYVSNLTGGDLGTSTGAFNWYINTTTDYNKFNVFNRYYVTDEATHEVTANDALVFSIGGSPDNHSTWIDFTANYLSFKGDTNFGETGMNHNMNFNGPSTFNNDATFQGNTHINGNTTFWKTDAEGGITPFASYDKSTGAFNIDYLTSSDGGNGENRVTIMADSREANYGATFNLPVTVSDASFKRTSTLAADDNSTEVPTTAWVKAAIAAGGGGSVPDDITCKTLKVTGTATVHELIAGDGYDGTKFTCNADASLNYNVNIGWTSGRLKCMRDEYNWLFDFNRNASPGSMLKFNDTVTILSAMPAATDSSNKVPTTAWVQGAITAKAATKPTLTYAEKSGEPTVTKIEQCNGGSLCTIMWTGQVSTATGHVYIDLPTEFASAKIVSTQFTAHDTGTAAPWTADASITTGKIMLSVKSTAASSSASATIVLYKA